MKLLETRTDVRLVPPAALKLDLTPPLLAPRPGAARTGTRAEPPALRPAARPGGKAAAGAAPVSWWTVRATAGEVTGGFSREEILKPVAEDPRKPGGLFDRVGTFLTALQDLAP
jgi:hypothetical protein